MRCTILARQATAAASTAARAAMPLASASRPMARAAVSRAAVASSSRQLSTVTIPHPELDPSLGHTRFVVKTEGKNGRINDIGQLYRIMRGVEAELGTILSIYVEKDAGSNEFNSTLFITLLRPVEFDPSTPRKITIPKFYKAEVRYPPMALGGGISLKEAERSLEPVVPDEDYGPAQPVNIRIEVSKKSGARELTEFEKKRVVPTPAEVQDDSALVQALKAFDGGFYGGLDGLADKYQHLIVEKQVEPVVEAAMEETVAPAAEAEAAESPVAETAAESPAAETAAAAAAETAAPGTEVTVTPVANEPAAEPKPMTKADRIRAQAIEVARINARHNAKVAVEKRRVEEEKKAKKAAAAAVMEQTAAAIEKAHRSTKSAPEDKEQSSGGWGSWFSGKK